MGNGEGGGCHHSAATHSWRTTTAKVASAASVTTAWKTLFLLRDAMSCIEDRAPTAPVTPVSHSDVLVQLALHLSPGMAWCTFWVVPLNPNHTLPQGIRGIYFSVPFGGGAARCRGFSGSRFNAAKLVGALYSFPRELSPPPAWYCPLTVPCLVPVRGCIPPAEEIPRASSPAEQGNVIYVCLRGANEHFWSHSPGLVFVPRCPSKEVRVRVVQ